MKTMCLALLAQLFSLSFAWSELPAHFKNDEAGEVYFFPALPIQLSITKVGESGDQYAYLSLFSGNDSESLDEQRERLVESYPNFEAVRGTFESHREAVLEILPLGKKIDLHVRNDLNYGAYFNVLTGLSKDQVSTLIRALKSSPESVFRIGGTFTVSMPIAVSKKVYTFPKGSCREFGAESISLGGAIDVVDRLISREFRADAGVPYGELLKKTFSSCLEVQDLSPVKSYTDILSSRLRTRNSPEDISVQRLHRERKEYTSPFQIWKVEWKGEGV